VRCPARPQIGLSEHLLGRFELALEPLDQRNADALAARIPARLARECVRLAHRLLGTLSDLSGQPVDRPQYLTPADACRGDRPHPLADRAAAIAQPAPRSKTGHPDPVRETSQPRVGVHTQTGVGRAANVCVHDRRVDAQSARAQHLALDRERKQLRVELLQQLRP
jgi:hypothetical protein